MNLSQINIKEILIIGVWAEKKETLLVYGGMK
jgi:hypothetical protein